MFYLKVGYRKVADFRRIWMDKVMVVNAEKVATYEQLQAMTEREARLQKKVSRLSADLQFSGAKLRLAHQNILLLSRGSRVRSILSTDFNENGMAILKNSKPSVEDIGPPWKGWHWPMMN